MRPPLKRPIMSKKDEDFIISDEIVVNKIIVIRRKKVMMDTDLAELYDVSTKRLNEQVKRNMKRFPEDFMFQLNPAEKQNLIESHPHLIKLKFSPNLPFAFTEHGAVMLASVLNSGRAIQVNVQIVRIFSKLRELAVSHKDILLKLEQMEGKLTRHDEEIRLIFQYLKELLTPSSEPLPKIGFKQKGE